jgi:MFS transporter, DHA2 family, multidrug resistance protein
VNATGVPQRARTRPRLPTFLTELTTDPVALRTLVAACAAIAAVSLLPHVFDPAMPLTRVAVKQDPVMRSLLTAWMVMQAGWLLVGGAVADVLRSERLARLALGGLILAALIAILWSTPLGLLASAVVGGLSVAIVLPFAVGAVAMTYRRAARATALGIVYAVYGAGSMVAPALALVNGPAGSPWPAFAVCATAAGLAIVITARLPDLPGAARDHRAAIVAVAVFAFGVLALATGLLQLGAGVDILGMGLLVLAAMALAASFLLRREAGPALRSMRLDLRSVAVALAIGVVVGFAQAVPLLQVPQFFMVIQGSEPLLAMIAVAPFLVALFLAGPVCGWLLARIGPRTLIAGGAVAIGIADLLIAWTIGRTTPYPAFVVPFLLIGAGFVIATTVRTAIIFASVPRELPASAAALNEASIGVGSIVGIIVALVVTMQTALGTYRAGLAGMPPERIEAAVTRGRELLNAYGMRPLESILAGVDPVTLEQYRHAVVEGMRVAEIIAGSVAVIAGILAFLAMGARDPVRSVWELADERGPARPPGPDDAPAPPGPAPS